MATSETVAEPVDAEAADSSANVKPEDKPTGDAEATDTPADAKPADDEATTEDNPSGDAIIDESKTETGTDSVESPPTVPDEVEQKDVRTNEISMEAKEESKDDEKKTDEEPAIDFEEIEKSLYEEAVGTNTNSLSFDDIKFENDEEKQGAIDLAKELETKHKLTNKPPFEMARYYIGSKCRIPKASKKWMDTIKIYKDYNLQSITEQQMVKCFRQMYKCMRFGGVDDKGRAVFAIKYSLWIPANFEGTDVIMKCFIMILNIFTENLDYSRNGMVFIADCKNMGWVNFNLDMEKIFTQLMQEVYPLRVGAMYMVDSPLLMNILMTICKPFLSKKMKERMHMVSSADMFQAVGKDQVPDIIEGGTYDDHTLTPMYHTCIRYMRRCNMDHFAPVEEEE